jgi:HPt (histidine-containing phosphotransfer) domain-containing protein
MGERLNADFVAELEDIMEEEFPLLLEAYLRESATQAASISEALHAGDMDALRRAAHSLKGGSGNIGAADLAALCARLETQARDAELGALPETLEAVLVELGAVRAEVGELRARH